MPQFRDKKPCSKCPLKRTSSPGWLGASTAAQFIEDVTHDGEMPCHMTIDYSEPDWFEKQFGGADVCIGAAQFLRNWMKMPRSGAMRDAVQGIRNPGFKPTTHAFGEEFPDIFGTPEEFLEHHDNDLNRAYVAASRAGELMSANPTLTYREAIMQAEAELEEKDD